MRTKDEKNALVIFLEGRIDTGNTQEVEKEVMDIAGANEGKELIFDAEALSYISSAGLRMLMKVRKLQKKNLEVRNVSRDVYDIFETTGFIEIFDVKKAYRSISIEGLEEIGRGFFGTVYRIDPERIVKVYKGKDSIPMIENEKRMAKKAFLSGIPTAISYDIVKVGEDYGSVFELLNARTFNELLESGSEPLDEIVSKHVGLMKLVHETELAPGTFPSCRERFIGYLDVIEPHLQGNQFQRLKTLFSDMEEQNTVVHGDIQPKNVMLVEGEPMLIDMDTLALGNPVFDFAGLFVAYKAFGEDEPDNAMMFFGLPQSVLDELWEKTLNAYFDFPGDLERTVTLSRICLVAAVRFLFLLESTELKESELGKKRIEHTKEHIAELLEVVDRLSI